MMVYVLVDKSDRRITGVYTDVSETRVARLFKTEETKRDYEVLWGELKVTGPVVQL